MKSPLYLQIRKLISKIPGARKLYARLLDARKLLSRHTAEQPQAARDIDSDFDAAIAALERAIQAERLRSVPTFAGFSEAGSEHSVTAETVSSGPEKKCGHKSVLGQVSSPS